ncbi:uroporphyrinogen-III synthase [Lujinxingia sediminis]|uniref:Uroporphyrinogen-III synthase n=2 Tax=Lujinxingia sediminis TaxID=2480984 RepID=A0ABY0CY43_9DELT|nr:uroporphyrinogen-III synthase [Lujinxingia sediminis]
MKAAPASSPTTWRTPWLRTSWNAAPAASFAHDPSRMTFTPETALRILDTGTRPAAPMDGVELLHCPALQVAWLEIDADALRARLNAPHLVIFYSARAAEAVLASTILTRDNARDHHLVAVGPMTAELLANALGVAVSVPAEHYFENLKDLLEKVEARDILAFGLLDRERDLRELAERRGVAFHPVPVYESLPDVAALRAALIEHRPHWITVTSSRGAEALHQALETLPALEPRPRLAAIGERTAERLRDLHLRVDRIAPSPDRDRLIEAILQDLS